MKVRNLVDIVRGYIREVDEQNSLGYQKVKMTVSMAVNDVFFQVFKKDSSNYDLYVKPYTVDIDFTTSFEPKVTLPTKIVQLQNIGDGIRQIMAVGSGAFNFSPISLDGLSLYYGTSLNDMDGSIPYAIRGNEIIFASFLPTDVAKVRLLIVRPFEAYGDDEEFYLPSGQDVNIVSRALSILGIRQPANLTNDNREQWQQQQQSRQQ